MFQNLRAVASFVPALTSIKIFFEDCPDAVAPWLSDGSFSWGRRRATLFMVIPGA